MALLVPLARLQNLFALDMIQGALYEEKSEVGMEM